MRWSSVTGKACAGAARRRVWGRRKTVRAAMRITSGCRRGNGGK